jgi:hypothetical protein
MSASNATETVDPLQVSDEAKAEIKRKSAQAIAYLRERGLYTLDHGTPEYDQHNHRVLRVAA